MTEPDTADAPRSAAVRTAIVVLGPLVILFMIAFIAGMIVAGSEHEGPHSLAYYGVLLVAAVIALAAVWVVWRNLAAFRLPASPRMRMSRIMLYICLALGLVIGIALGIAEGPEPAGAMALLSSTTPISPVAAAVLAAGFLLTTAISIRWHVLLDEHEMAAYNFGAVVGVYVYMVLSVCWWVLARGGLVAEVNGYAIFWAVMLAWMIGWAFKRYR